MDLRVDFRVKMKVKDGEREGEMVGLRVGKGSHPCRDRRGLWGGEREQKSDWGRAHTALSRKIETKLSNAALP